MSNKRTGEQDRENRVNSVKSVKPKPLPRPRRPRKAGGKAEPWPPRRLLLPSLDELLRLSEPTADETVNQPAQALLFDDAEA